MYTLTPMHIFNTMQAIWYFMWTAMLHTLFHPRHAVGWQDISIFWIIPTSQNIHNSMQPSLLNVKLSNMLSPQLQKLRSRVYITMLAWRFPSDTYFPHLITPNLPLPSKQITQQLLVLFTIIFIKNDQNHGT